MAGRIFRHFGTVFRHQQQDALAGVCSLPVCGTLRHRKTSSRSYSDTSNIVKSSFPDIKLPEVPFHEFIFEGLGQWEEKIALDCGATGKKWTYKDLWRYSRNLAGSLQKKFKLQKGDFQAIVLPNCPEYAAIYLAGSMAGVVATTVNPIYTPAEISRQLDLVQPKILFTVPECYKQCMEALKLMKVNIPVVVVKLHPNAEIPSGAVSFSELSESSTLADIDPVNWNINDDLVVPFSSGTSGLPKGVQLSTRNITANLAQFSDCFTKTNPNNETNQNVVLAVLPMFHIYGMVTVTFDALRWGSRLVVLPKFEPKLFLETIYTKKTEILYLAPPLVAFLANHPSVEEKHLQSVRQVFSGAAPCGLSQIEGLLKKRPAMKFGQGYGLTETSPVITFTPLDRGHKTTSVGHPLKLTSVRIADIETGKSLPCGSHGEIRVKGPQVMKGYYKRPKETKETFDEDGWYRTGDIGYFDEDRDFYVIDRLKELIKVKGLQVAPTELEEVLRTHPEIVDAGVVGVPHPRLGEAPKAFVVLKQGSTLDEEKVKNFVKESLSAHKHLEGGVRFLKELPKSSAGKLLRKELVKLE